MRADSQKGQNGDKLGLICNGDVIFRSKVTEAWNSELKIEN
jgi:hypothetical protein